MLFDFGELAIAASCKQKIVVGTMDKLSAMELVQLMEGVDSDAMRELCRRALNADNEKIRADNEKIRADNLQAQLDNVRWEIDGYLLIIERKQWSASFNSCSHQHNAALCGAR